MMTTATTTVGRHLLDRLYGLGVRHIFGIPGDYIIRFDKLIEQHPIEFINATRENTAGYLADAYARVTGLGVACVTYGVGINIVNATSQAYVESSPLVVISGAAGTRESSLDGSLHHLLNRPVRGGVDSTQMEIFQKITVDQARLTDPKTAASDIERVLQSCLFHKKPVYIELPRDHVDEAILTGATPLGEPPKSDPHALQEALEETARILGESRRPIIWAGHELARRRLADPLMEFAQQHQIPIASSLLGKGIISEHHPLFLGVYQGAMSQPEIKAYAEKCDVALVLGVLFSDVDTGHFTDKLGPKNKIVAHPTEVIIGHHHYPDVLLGDYLQGLKGLAMKKSYPVDFPRWAERPAQPFKAKNGAATTTRRFFDCLESHLRPEHILVSDIGDCLFGSLDLTVEKDSYIACSFWASLGFAVPAAVGAQFGAPERRVIAVVGDGAFQMTATELATAVYYGLDPIIIVLNNHGYGMERPLLEGRYNDILNWNYAEIPRLLGGGHGVRVTSEDGLDKALTEALERRGMFSLIEVELGKTDFSAGMHRFGAVFGKTV